MFPPTPHSVDVNYHPANEYARFLEGRGSEVSYCPFAELIEQCGALVGIDVVAIGKENGRYCGVVIPAHHHESGSTYMACQTVAIELATRLKALEAHPVSDEELLSLRTMERTNRQDVFNRLDHLDQREEILGCFVDVFSKQHSPRVPRTEEILISWAKEKLTELEEKATGPMYRFRSASCPQAPKDHGPMIRY